MLTHMHLHIGLTRQVLTTFSTVGYGDITPNLCSVPEILVVSLVHHDPCDDANVFLNKSLNRIDNADCLFFVNLTCDELTPIMHFR